jgi:hypothetical protein
VPATSVLVDSGPRVQEIVKAHPQQVQVLQQVDPAVLAVLQRSPDDPQAQVQALTQISGLPADQVTRAVTLGAKYKEELTTAAAIDQVTLLALSKNPADAQAGARAVAGIVSKLGISPQQALARLAALGKVPATDTSFMLATGPKVQAAATRLASLSTVPPSDLKFLADNAQDVADAQRDAPEQWQTYWWIAFAGQVLFIPFIFVLWGRWSPSKAAEDDAEHERMVEQELARLEQARLAAGS